MRPRLSLLCLATLVACSGAAPKEPATGLTASPIASTVPLRMTLPLLSGGDISLEAFRPRPVLLTLFTTWCLPCQQDAPLLVRLHERFAPRGLAVLGVALNSQGQSPARLVQLYVEAMGFRFPVALAPPDNLELIGALGRTPLLPRSVLLDGEGRAVLDQIGYTDLQELERRITALLARPGAPAGG